jgi:hypothetical protein
MVACLFQNTFSAHGVENATGAEAGHIGHGLLGGAAAFLPMKDRTKLMNLFIEPLRKAGLK